MIPSSHGRRAGVVAAYDDHAGFGEIEPAGSGGKSEPSGESQRFWFHCTALVDGTRHAEAGQQVTFRVVPGHCGRWEATEIA